MESFLTSNNEVITGPANNGASIERLYLYFYAIPARLIPFNGFGIAPLERVYYA